MFKEQIKPAVLIFAILTVITGIAYPLFITGASRILFHAKANGSLIYRDGKAIGSNLIGQQFDDPKYFWGRLSATSPTQYNAASSSGSNIGPANPALIEAVKARIQALRSADPDNKYPIPVDLVTSSASGLDPHISVAAAYYQIPRVARARGMSQKEVMSIVSRHSSSRVSALIGAPVMNVLEVNLELDEFKK